MEKKWSTLWEVYNLVKANPNPTRELLNINELILRQKLPWDEVVSHLVELEKEEYISMMQLSVAAVSLTEKGMQYFEAIPKVNMSYQM